MGIFFWAVILQIVTIFLPRLVAGVPQSPLLHATLRQDGVAVAELLKNGADANVVELIESASLESLGFPVVSKGPVKATPLLTAAFLGNEEIVGALLRAGVSTEEAGTNGMRPLHLAALSGQGAVVKLLLEVGANIDAVDDSGATALWRALSQGQGETARLLVSLGANINNADVAGKSPLRLAVDSREEESFQLLLRLGADLNLVDNHGVSPLLQSIFEGRSEFTRHLIDADADVNLADDSGIAALFAAVENEDFALVKRLIEKGAEVDRLTIGGISPWSLASISGQEEVAHFLESKGAKVTDWESRPGPHLSGAVRIGNTSLAKRLLARGADIEAPFDENGLSPLLLAIVEGQSQMAKFLIDAGAEPIKAHVVAAERVRGRHMLGRRLEITPLLAAAEFGDPATVKELVSAGADVDEVTRERKTALLLATLENRHEVVEVLLDAGADPDKLSRGSMAPLLVATRNRDMASVKLLLDAGAEVNIADQRGLTPINEALNQGATELVEMLMSYGADPNASSDTRGFVEHRIDTWGFDPSSSASFKDGLLGSPSAKRAGPRGLALDAEGGWLYWTEFENDRIRRSRLDGSRAETIVEETDGPIGLVVDSAGANLYWVTDGSYPRKVRHSKIGTSDVASLIEGRYVNRPRAIAIDDDSKSLYWSESISGRIRRSKLDGTEVVDLVTSGISSLQDRADRRAFSALGLALDVERETLYWSDAISGKILRAKLDGSGKEQIVSGLDFPVGIALDHSESRVYWADYGAERIQSQNFDGSDRKDLVTDVAPYSLAFDPAANKIYWSDPSANAIFRSDVEQPSPQLVVSLGNSEAAEIEKGLDCTSVRRLAYENFSRRVQKRASVCMQKIDMIKAVKRSASDAVAAASTCVRQLGTVLDALSTDTLEGQLRMGIDAGCFSGGDYPDPKLIDRYLGIAWQNLASSYLRIPEWIEEVRPFIDTVEASRAQKEQALAILKKIYSHVSSAQTSVSGSARPSKLPATGQRTSFRAQRKVKGVVADDGMLRSGIAARYRDNGDGTISDLITGLMWEKKCDCPDHPHHYGNAYPLTSDAEQGGSALWLDRLNSESDSGFAGHDDWRIPTAKEFHTIIDYERFNPAVTIDFDGSRCGLGCVDMKDPECSCTAMSTYWTSTPYVNTPSRQVAVAFHLGLIGDRHRGEPAYLRAVRGRWSGASLQ